MCLDPSTGQNGLKTLNRSLPGDFSTYRDLPGHYNAYRGFSSPIGAYRAIIMLTGTFRANTVPTGNYRVPLMLHDAIPGLGMSSDLTARSDLLLENGPMGFTYNRGFPDIHPSGHIEA